MECTLCGETMHCSSCYSSTDKLQAQLQATQDALDAVTAELKEANTTIDLLRQERRDSIEATATLTAERDALKKALKQMLWFFDYNEYPVVRLQDEWRELASDDKPGGAA